VTDPPRSVTLTLGVRRATERDGSHRPRSVTMATTLRVQSHTPSQQQA